jgi:hypothetical protein
LELKIEQINDAKAVEALLVSLLATTMQVCLLALQDQIWLPEYTT